MAVPTTLADVESRTSTLLTEVTELEAGCRKLGAGSSAGAQSAHGLRPVFGQIRKTLQQAGYQQTKTNLS